MNWDAVIASPAINLTTKGAAKIRLYRLEKKLDPLIATEDTPADEEPADEEPAAGPVTPKKRKAAATIAKPAAKKTKVNGKGKQATVTDEVEDDVEDDESIDVKEEAVSEED